MLVVMISIEWMSCFSVIFSTAQSSHNSMNNERVRTAYWKWEMKDLQPIELESKINDCGRKRKVSCIIKGKESLFMFLRIRLLHWSWQPQFSLLLIFCPAFSYFLFVFYLRISASMHFFCGVGEVIISISVNLIFISNISSHLPFTVDNPSDNKSHENHNKIFIFWLVTRFKMCM